MAWKSKATEDKQPQETYMDKVNRAAINDEPTPGGEVMETGGNQDAVSAENSQDVQVDHDAFDVGDPEFDREPEQVQDETVVYVPRKDFDARVNDQPYRFTKGVPHIVSRDLANMLLEDEDRGYVKE